MKKFNFTVKRIERLKAEKKDVEYSDLEIKGLKLRVYANGSKVWRWKGTDQLTGKRRNMRIGSYPTLSLSDARNAADQLNNNVENGKTPRTKIEIQKGKETFGQLFNRHMETYCKVRKTTWKDDQSKYDIHISDIFGDVPAADITQEDIMDFRHKLLSVKGLKTGRYLTKATVERITAVISATYTKTGKKYHNPCLGIESHEEIARDEFIKQDQIPEFVKQLNASKTRYYVRDIIWIALHTGARRGNIFSMQWSEIDFTTRQWTIPGYKFKNRKSHTIKLNDNVIEILTRIRKTTKSLYVFPPTKKGAKSPHITNIHKAWLELAKRSGIEGKRFHDLRRTAGSIMVAAGVPALVIVRTLGQRSPQMIKTYQQIQDNATSEAIEAGSNKLDEMINGKKDSNIIDIRRAV